MGCTSKNDTANETPSTNTSEDKATSENQSTSYDVYSPLFTL